MKITKTNLGKGDMEVYDFGNIKLHAYATNDFLADECFILEKNNSLVLIEQPCFYDNYKELESYIQNLNKNVLGKILSYHLAGGKFLPNVTTYTTVGAETNFESGAGRALITNFISSFGEVFDSSISPMDTELTEDHFTLGDISFMITYHDSDFDIVLPEINVIYTHMLGADVHSIIVGENHSKILLDTLKDYQKKQYTLILSSHYVPENLKAVSTKIAYIEKIVEFTKSTTSPEEFKEKTKAEFPNYSGLNYLDITAGAFFA